MRDFTWNGVLKFLEWLLVAAVLAVAVAAAVRLSPGADLGQNYADVLNAIALAAGGALTGHHIKEGLEKRP
jgi:hypothetical protein